MSKSLTVRRHVFKPSSRLTVRRHVFKPNKSLTSNQGAAKLSGILAGETGSLSLLIITLFLLLLVFSFMIIDVSDAYLAKRELINLGEVAITDAAHSLSISRYYSGDRTADDASGDGLVYRVPIDCNAAAVNFENSLNAARLRGVSIAMNAWSCVNDEVTATISAPIVTAVRLPLGLNSATESISATISATSIINGSR
jgi:Flp pilus assembly protein TadG